MNAIVGAAARVLNDGTIDDDNDDDDDNVIDVDADAVVVISDDVDAAVGLRDSFAVEDNVVVDAAVDGDDVVSDVDVDAVVTGVVVVADQPSEQLGTVILMPDSESGGVKSRTFYNFTLGLYTLEPFSALLSQLSVCPSDSVSLSLAVPLCPSLYLCLSVSNVYL